ncbi:MAG: aspartate kinase, monofunctional class [Firmicutes bacterium]|nr:aspartate kinase, monofunctional class [Bacillota bacterium]
MRILVQKFGGTSVASPEARACVVEKIRQALKKGFMPVVVVSAMGRKGDNYATDTLIGLAREACRNIAQRELDHIMYCGEMISAVIMTGFLQAAGIDAVMMTGGQAGIVTDNRFTNARVLNVDPTKINNQLRLGRVPVVCGFQGMTADGEFTTLGRGGSDTSASLLGAALDAELIEIYTDVEGIMTADPRIVKNAKILDVISYGEVAQLAYQGAKVIHPRAVEIAAQKNIPLVIKSTFSDAPGTMIVKECHEQTVTDRLATGVTHLPNIAQIKVDVDDVKTHKESSVIFRTLADAAISVDLINVHPGHVMFTVAEEMADEAIAKLTSLGYNAEVNHDCAKVSVVGGGICGVPGVMASFTEALSMYNIPIMQTVDSHTTISVLVKLSDVETAVKALHEKFLLA